MAKVNRIEFSKEALYAELKKRGVEVKEASVAIGYSANYLANCGNEGLIAKPATMLLEQLYGIPVEAYTGVDKHEGLFNCDDLIAEIKELRGIFKEQADDMSDIRYVLNIIAQDLKIIREELVPTKDESEVDNV